jgi:E3 ubiquitin-protein ligase UBR1
MLGMPSTLRGAAAQAAPVLTQWLTNLKQFSVDMAPQAGLLSRVSRLDAGFAPVELVRLPRDFDEVFEATDDAKRCKCLSCGKLPKSPVLCLHCGEILCLGSSCCRKNGIGEVCSHTQSCSPCNGAFLFLKQSSILLVAEGMAIDYGSPYVDSHGEMDLGLTRGRSLHLDAERWAQICSLVANQDMISLISRQLNQAQRMYQRWYL